jgi:hypothetical protein
MVSTPAGGTSDMACERKLEISIPISRSTAIASERMDAGLDPADRISTPGGAGVRAIPSAIWLRAEFATHKSGSFCVGAALERIDVS